MNPKQAKIRRIVGPRRRDLRSHAQAVDLVEVVRPYVRKLLPCGRSLKTACIFHRDARMSMVISPDRRIFHCFGCGVGGDAIGFLMKVKGVPVAQALRLLAKMPASVKREERG